MSGKRSKCSVTAKEWKQMPILLGVDEVSELLGVRKRWVSEHAEELGGRKFAARWTFAKADVARLLGIE